MQKLVQLIYKMGVLNALYDSLIHNVFLPFFCSRFAHLRMLTIAKIVILMDLAQFNHEVSQNHSSL